MAMKKLYTQKKIKGYRDKIKTMFQNKKAKSKILYTKSKI